MTTRFTKKVRCALCRHRSPQRWVASTQVSGPPDLDLRPAKNARSMLRFSVQVCPSCGYSALDIARADDRARAAVRTEAFQALRTGPLGDTLAGRLLRAALIVRHQGDLGLAGELTLGAAWAADDDGDSDQARTCRNEAVELMSAALETLDPGAEEAEHTATRLTDVLRRAGRFDEAVGLADRLLACDPDPTLKAVLAFERHRAVASDVAADRPGHAAAPAHHARNPWISRRRCARRKDGRSDPAVHAEPSLHEETLPERRQQPVHLRGQHGFIPARERQQSRRGRQVAPALRPRTAW
ncbi:hypothetical protein SAMN05421720_106224 [Rhodospira trueperi]|uniref:DUF2225 domain-containing protein n=1 Tax=Rhodospira trueperi TaxID=69960 RepID=A0A1G7CU86_9PROT|nr:hypothetical protein SAMN05421720_106224 [Rhodospira trueperi]